MATKAEAIEQALIDSACERVRERLSGDDAEQVEEFVRQYYRWLPPEDLVSRSPLDVYGAALAHWNFAGTREPGTTKVRVYNPDFEQHGWQSTHTVIEAVCDDMPFLVDSVSMEVNRLNYRIHLALHPVIRVDRDGEGRLTRIYDADSGGQAESMMHLEVDRQADPAELEELERNLQRILGDVRDAVDDWPAMRERTREISAEFDSDPPPLDASEIQEGKALLAWLDDHHFTFLGYREYELVTEDGDDHLYPIAGTGLGILRESESHKRPSGAFAKLPARVKELARRKRLFNLTKANSKATVHRPSYLDYVSVMRFDESGEVMGERRFLGLYTVGAYKASATEIPVVRRKLQMVLDRAGFTPGSHNEKALIETLETYPRDELFQITVDDLYEAAMGIVGLGERQQVRLFVRPDQYERFLSCLVFLPRDRFHTRNRERVQQILREAFNADTVDWALRISDDSVLVRIHLVAHVAGELPSFDTAEIEQRIVEATRAWHDDLQDVLMEERGEAVGNDWFRRYGSAFPAAYQEDWIARSAVADIARIEGLADQEGLGMSLYHPLEAPGDVIRCKLFSAGVPLALSDLLPMFENMGLKVVDERPYEVTPAGSAPVWIFDFGLSYGASDGYLELDRVRDDFREAFASTWSGRSENDGFNALVLRAGLTAREITIVRAVARYLRQAGITFSDRYMEDTLAAHPLVTRKLVDLFAARFDPDRERDGAADELAGEIAGAIDEVESLDQDRILRSFLVVIEATLRTNFFQPGPDGATKPYLSFKLDPTQVPLLPLPRPPFEIFVYSPRIEGVHLRGGSVARGGLRWSDRREDFRTEVLGLMKAQMVKNALIVPVGAKGGFVVKRPPTEGGREALAEEVVACYRTFLSGLLDITDNIVEGKCAPPPRVVRYDDDDPYLVVAADKGTATFSDIANGVAADYGFWLGDAFASGGSAGYDHKAMGITARSAWESVKRHFRSLGLDTQSEDFTVAGVGDMSGDVFGNGMLLSEHIRLVGAFDHRHVFLDPDPDPAAGFAERQRLFELERSSWEDYDQSLISEGGGIWPRTAKSIAVSAQVRELLDVDDEAMTPNDLISALLRAPVDLLWNGGIGTYVKASDETHGDVGDKANDAVRVDGRELRCRVVGEGGNLGFTQRGRTEFALGGGLVNTDAIDNAGGVNCSDREVNIKVLLGAIVDDGAMTSKQRDALLEEMTDGVAELVLRDSYRQTQALGLANAQALSMIDVHHRFMRTLEQAGKLNREIEFLPDSETISERRNAGQAVALPELAVLFAYSKIVLYPALLDSDLPEDPYLSRALIDYFPDPLPERYTEQMKSHRLRREIIATQVTNTMVDRAGLTFAFRLAEETSAAPSEIARAFTAAVEVYGMRARWSEIEALDNVVATKVQATMLLGYRRLVERATRWLLQHCRRPLDIAETVERFSGGAQTLGESLTDLLCAEDCHALEGRAAELVEAGVPSELAGHLAAAHLLFYAFDIVTVSESTGEPVRDVAALHLYLGDRLHLHWLRDSIAALPRDDRWQAMARAAQRDDLFALHGELTASMLRGSEPGHPPEARYEAWAADRSAACSRCRDIVGEIHASDTHDLTTLAVALREVRNLIQSTG